MVKEIMRRAGRRRVGRPNIPRRPVNTQRALTVRANPGSKVTRRPPVFGGRSTVIGRLLSPGNGVAGLQS